MITCLAPAAFVGLIRPAQAQRSSGPLTLGRNVHPNSDKSGAFWGFLFVNVTGAVEGALGLCVSEKTTAVFAYSINEVRSSSPISILIL